MKFLIKITIGLILLILIPITTISSVLTYFLLQPSTYQDSLENSGIYQALNEQSDDFFINVINEELNKELRVNFGVELEDDFLKENFSELINQTSKRLLNPDDIQNIIDQNMSLSLDYLRNNNDEFEIFIPQNYIESVLSEDIPIIYEESVEIIQSIDTCNSNQIQNFSNDIQINCLPESIKNNYINGSEDFLLKDWNTIIDEFLQNETLFSSEDTLTIRDYYTAIDANQREIAEYEQLIEDLENIRNFVNVYISGILGLWIFIIVGLIIYISVSSKANILKLFSPAPLFFLSGITVLGIGGILLVTQKVIQNSIEVTLSEESEVISNVSQKFISEFLGQLNGYIIGSGIGLILLSVIMLVFWFIPAGKNKKISEKEESHPKISPETNIASSSPKEN